MAGHGPAGKEKHSRERDDQPFEELTVTGAMYGAPLPEGVLPDGESWHAQTLAFWVSLRQSPLLAEEHAMGWQFLIDTALMHHVMWTKGRWDFASEVRLRVAKFGATPEDRLRLKVKITAPERPTGSVSATVTDIRGRRTRLSG